MEPIPGRGFTPMSMRFHRYLGYQNTICVRLKHDGIFMRLVIWKLPLSMTKFGKIVFHKPDDFWSVRVFFEF